jgi:hypothetical protein
MHGHTGINIFRQLIPEEDSRRRCRTVRRAAFAIFYKKPSYHDSADMANGVRLVHLSHTTIGQNVDRPQKKMLIFHPRYTEGKTNGASSEMRPQQTISPLIRKNRLTL